MEIHVVIRAFQQLPWLPREFTFLSHFSALSEQDWKTMGQALRGTEMHTSCSWYIEPVTVNMKRFTQIFARKVLQVSNTEPIQIC